MENISIDSVRRELTNDDVIRVGINASNFLLVSRIDDSGIPYGIAPDLGRKFAEKINAEISFVVRKTPGELADAGKNGEWDIAFLGNEPQRAKEIAFSEPYLEIPVTFMVRGDSAIQSIQDIDQVGVRISVMNRSAYDLFLTNILKKATLVRSGSIDDSYENFVKDNLEVLGGLKPRLVADAQKVVGSRILDGQITSVKQSAGTLPDRKNTAKYLYDFIENAKRTGIVDDLIAQYEVIGVSVAPLASE